MRIEGAPDRGPAGRQPASSIPPRTPHDALDVGPGTGRMLSTYLVEIGEPLATVLP